VAKAVGIPKRWIKILGIEGFAALRASLCSHDIW
jgi:hypothetical protein